MASKEREPAGLQDHSRYFEWSVVILYICITAFVAAHHEPWRDEADAWLRARDASLATILTDTGYTGSPALWYLLLAPLAKSGLPYASQAVLNLVMLIAAVAVFLWTAPFNRVTKLLFVFSYYILYEYAIVARVYGLSVLLLVLAASSHRARFARPLVYATPLFLLFNTSSHSFFFAGVLSFTYIYEIHLQKRDREIRRRTTAAVALLLLGGLLGFIQLRTPPDADITGGLRMVRLVSIPEAFGEAFLPRADSQVAFWIGLAVVAAFTVALRERPEALLLFWASIAFLTYVFVYVYVGGRRHYGYVLVLLVIAAWIAWSDRPSSERPAERLAVLLLDCTLVFSVGVGLFDSYRDVRYTYSGSKEMAAFMLAHGYDRRVVAAHRAPDTAAVLPYLGDQAQFWFAATGEFGSYMKYDRTFGRGLYMTFGEAEQRTRQAFRGRRDYLFLANNFMYHPESHGYRLLFMNREEGFEHPEETFYLYEPLQ